MYVYSYKVCVRPIITYCMETRADTGETKKILQTTGMKSLRMLRSIARKTDNRTLQSRKLCHEKDTEKGNGTSMSTELALKDNSE